MCRLLAYLGPDRSLEHLLLTPPHSLLRQSWAPRFQTRGTVNADGFGVGWYVPAVRPEPVQYRRAMPIWSDRSFASLAGTVLAPAVLASVRDATPPSPSEETSTAPYLAGRWLFAHNGEVRGFAAGGKVALLAALSVERAATITGTADSEVLFALALDQIDAGAPPAAALEAVVRRIQTASPGSRLNMVLTDGEHLGATACGDSLFVLETGAPHGAQHSTVIASEPYDDDPAWVRVADGSVVAATRGEPSRTRPMVAA
ncbi:MAG TPA: ergothioneine biosynthesis protein EgtC [Actinomycetota bacterium]|nr:ergothioneine biosynthesis protein EgtC [Actinomycetota bacterium]